MSADPPIERPPVVITAAVTGALTVPGQSAAIPFTPEQIVDAAVAACDAGAAVVHVHARDPQTGRPASDLELFTEILDGIAARCAAVVEVTTGGSPGQSIAERAAVVTRLRPELATLNAGSVNIAVFLAADGAVGEALEDWEREYLLGTRDYVFKNTFADMEGLSSLMDDAGTVPSFEVFDVGHIHNVKYLVDRGLVPSEPHIQFTLGIMGGISASTEHFMHMLATARSLFGHEFTFAGVGAGYPATIDIAAMSVLNGGHVRVGLEDSLWARPGELAESNAELVERAVELAAVFDRRPASPTEARAILGVRRRDDTT